jgi:hypothetical protein
MFHSVVGVSIRQTINEEISPVKGVLASQSVFWQNFLGIKPKGMKSWT